ncbi:hypothetical protein NC653_022254 [Populus alba x Populus x berolinensis]|uniref:Secreted protein n=1 Tax=Populus alba x Populus x berolinensis TaxID=444605 RepID=A0AAD6MGP3_9ROSI|nr:hypothetical protein NC653_022254 [Populus alba x Populus x berolinensis]
MLVLSFLSSSSSPLTLCCTYTTNPVLREDILDDTFEYRHVGAPSLKSPNFSLRIASSLKVSGVAIESSTKPWVGPLRDTSPGATQIMLFRSEQNRK